MEFFLKHWDGYSRNTNNTYLYNDVAAVESPGVDDVNFKMIPWGLDQTLQPGRHFRIDTSGLLAKLVRGDAGRRAQLIDQIGSYRDSVFGRDVQQTVLSPLLEQVEGLLTSFGVPDAPAQIATVRKQLRLAASAGYLSAGLPGPGGAYIREDATNDCMHASNSERVPAEPPGAANFEVVHRPRTAATDDSDLWCFGDLGSGKSITSKAFGRALHASAATSSQGHQLLYTCAPNNADQAEEFEVTTVDPADDEFAFSGYFTLKSVRTELGANFGSDTTAGGKPRVHQDSSPSQLFFS